MNPSHLTAGVEVIRAAQTSDRALAGSHRTGAPHIVAREWLGG